ncbi:Retrovirus-related Pol polyprotein from transposon TNT 1-94 [Symbiodinium microadriaticum]|uniref:Retrovirus-related Pol polyprotein from transposon TNT 1-94 n=1 Tax=Symbiodinium microadriaticum TaxID=2951 RepID=A0A1Q9E5T2_SYMMI|nr:Retrovirus-related Pol polyprotein from transposon TNT 1-94 [Symbiodinium microadriaticum]
MFRRHRICEEKYWSVHQALYGLTISPRSWSVHRDGTLTELRFAVDGAPVRVRPMTSDPNIWIVYREEDHSVVVYLALYVDDMLAVGATSHVQQTLDKLCQVWKCTEPVLLSETGSVTFNGFEVSLGLDGTLYVHQIRYIQELLQRYEVGEPLQVPCEGQPQTPDEEDKEGFEGRVQKAQQLGGELLWLSTHSRCDLAYAVSVISAWMTKYPAAAVERGHKVLRYLKAYPELCLKYGPAPNDKGPEGVLKVERAEDLVEGYSDASFAPESSRSHGAFLTVWAGSTINWCSKKQAYMTMSTCESELGALSDSGQAVVSVCPLINEFLAGRAMVPPHALLQEQNGPTSRARVVLYTDNTASVAVVSLPGCQGLDSDPSAWGILVCRCPDQGIEQPRFATSRAAGQPDNEDEPQVASDPLLSMSLKSLEQLLAGSSGEQDRALPSLLERLQRQISSSADVSPAQLVTCLQLLCGVDAPRNYNGDYRLLVFQVDRPPDDSPEDEDAVFSSALAAALDRLADQASSLAPEDET